MTLGIIATLSSSEDNNSTTYIQKGDRGIDCFTYEEKSCMDDSTTLINIGNSKLCTEGKTCGIVAIPDIKRTVDNDYTNILHGPLKRYIYRNMISKSIITEVAIQRLIQQTIF